MEGNGTGGGKKKGVGKRGNGEQEQRKGQKREREGKVRYGKEREGKEKDKGKKMETPKNRRKVLFFNFQTLGLLYPPTLSNLGLPNLQHVTPKTQKNSKSPPE